MADIDIGAACIDRGSTWPAGETVVSMDNPANAAGTIEKVFIWASFELSFADVAIFYKTNGTIFSTRDSEAIGTVPAGSSQEFAVNLDVQVGDYIGMFFTSGSAERDKTGFQGVYYKTGKYVPCTEQNFSFLAGDTISLYGESVAAPSAEPAIFFSHNF